ncbi:MAG: lipoate--protein ligase family protein [Cyclobacteriaceae bacterium]|nr:lipoate--protein ligase family protein [Cyclobacteriaceae bacterium]
MVVRLVDAGSVSGLRSQSIYHGLAYAQTNSTANTVVLAVPEDPYLCIGYFQDVGKELNLAYCERHQLPIVRRETGGGCVYIDRNQLFVQWIFQAGFLPRKVEQWFRVFNQPLIETYKFFGIEAYHFSINDVHAGGKKIVGTGAATIGEAEVVTGNFIFNFNSEHMTQALMVPNNMYREYLSEGLKKYISSFHHELGYLPDPAEVKRVYVQNVEKTLGVRLQPDAFTDAEYQAMEQVERQFEKKEWVEMIHSEGHRERLVKIHAGVWLGYMETEKNGHCVSALIQMIDDRIDRLFISNREGTEGCWETGELEQKLVGQPMKEEVVRSIVVAEFDAMKQSPLDIDEWVHLIMKIKISQQKMSGYG